MAQINRIESKVTKIGSLSIDWELKDWKETHPLLVATKASCPVRFEGPNQTVTFRFFLRPINKTRCISQTELELRYYSLCADILESNVTGAVKVNTTFQKSDGSKGTSNEGEISIRKSTRDAGVVVCEEFIIARQWSTTGQGNRNPMALNGIPDSFQLLHQPNITIKFECTLFEMNGNGDIDDKSRAIKPAEPEASMVRHIKTMYAAKDNYADLRLETKDNMKLRAHKFQLAARSPVLRTMIDEAVKKEGFDGIIKMEDVNAKALMVILHWIYSGELHETAGKVMGEVVEAAMKYQLLDLLKILDKELIEICNVENMFQLFQVAKKIPMPTAIDDISLFIKQNLG